MTLRFTPAWVAAAGALLLAGCGSGGAATSTSASTGATMGPGSQPTASGSTQAGGGGGPLVAEAQAAASGDIPDNQVFLTFHDKTSGYSMKYPEGWALSGSGSVETIRDKNNLIRIAVTSGSAPTLAQVR